MRISEGILVCIAAIILGTIGGIASAIIATFMWTTLEVAIMIVLKMTADVDWWSSYRTSLAIALIFFAASFSLISTGTIWGWIGYKKVNS